MNIGVLAGLIVDVIVITLVILYVVGRQRVTKARRYAVTLRNNEGAFIALCTERRRDRWVFEDVKITPNNPGGEYRAAAPGKLYVPVANILYYQEISEVSNVSQ